MFNALIEEYPEEIMVHGKLYQIDSDFRRWIGLNEALMDAEMTDEERVLLIIDLFVNDAPEDIAEAVESIMLFLQGNVLNTEKKSSGDVKKNSRYVFSFTYDQDYIIGAFLEYYNIDLLNFGYMHWWHFNALLNALNEESELKKRVMYRSIRLSDIPDKKERNRIRKIQRKIAIPAAEMSEEDIASVF